MNRLHKATSLYLQQHADNPVHWQPWDEQALQQARQEQKLILLSIGYSACHWCHVMAHECFADAEIAAVMNQHFVCIKVDREERPDLDRIYQQAYQLLNGRAGGWPLNVILTPEDQAPFFAFTYVSKHSRGEMPGLVELLQRLVQFYQQQPTTISAQNQQLIAALQAGAPRQGTSGYALNPAPLEQAVQQLMQSFDTEHGGFGSAPKFPQIPALERLLRHSWHCRQQQQTDDKTQAAVMLSLEKMALGGLFDQIGGGFFRYSTDKAWQIPHFEKMLYDNGQLLSIYSAAYADQKNPLFKTIIEQTIDWANREMRSPEGAYYSALDADSDGEEGQYYRWTSEQLQALLNPQQSAEWGLNQEPNFGNYWHLTWPIPDALRQRLQSVRDERTPPSRDEKIITAWNALMIKGLARTGWVLQQPEYIEQAEQTLDFLRTKLWYQGRLYTTYQQGQRGQLGFLDDYALLVDAILELLHYRWREADFRWALELTEVLLEQFQDTGKQGGFYFTSHEHESLVARPKPVYDETLPGGNGMAVYNLLRLGHLCSDLNYLRAAERVLKYAWPIIERRPMACCGLLLALELYYFPGQIIVLRGDQDELVHWQAAGSVGYQPRRLILAIPNTEVPELLQRYPTLEEGVVAYVCEGSQCLAPIGNLAEFQRLLN